MDIYELRYISNSYYMLTTPQFFDNLMIYKKKNPLIITYVFFEKLQITW